MKERNSNKFRTAAGRFLHKGTAARKGDSSSVGMERGAAARLGEGEVQRQGKEKEMCSRLVGEEQQRGREQQQGRKKQ